MKKIKNWATTLLLCISGYSHADFVAKVVGITDGDTLTVLTENHQQVKIRLANIDAPEKNQPYGEKAKQALSDLTFNRYVYVKEHGFDKYGRLIATLMLGNDPVNRLMVSKGMARSYKQYNTDPVIDNLEIYAKKQKIGLWQDANPITPSEWRKMQKESQ